MRDVYMVNMIIGIGIVLYVINLKRWLSLLLMIIIIPLMGGYMRMLNGIMGRIRLNESCKKMIVLILVMVLGGVVMEFAYVSVFIYFVGGVLRTVILGVYVFMLMTVCIWVALFTYLLLGLIIQDNYKILGIGVLPLVIFFVKICGSWLLLWIVIIYSINNLL